MCDGALKLTAGFEERADLRSECIHIDQERIVTLDAVQWSEADVFHYFCQTDSQLFLLLQRKQEIGLDADNQGFIQLQFAETGLQRAAVLGQIEKIGRTRQV